MNRHREIEAIILAAGKGERMGTIKPLVGIDGQPALERVIETLDLASVDRVIVVLGYKAKEITEMVDLSNCERAINLNYERGMGTSLALGVKMVSKTSLGFLVCHADMPYIEQQTVRKVLDVARKGARIAAPIYRGTRGFPVYLSVDCVSDLLKTLKGDSGARNYILEHVSDVELVEVNDPGAVIDVDQPQDVIGYQL